LGAWIAGAVDGGHWSGLGDALSMDMLDALPYVLCDGLSSGVLVVGQVVLGVGLVLVLGVGAVFGLLCRQDT